MLDGACRDRLDATRLADLASHLGAENGSGAGHAACAKACAQKGQSVALVTESGDVYMLAGAVIADSNAALVAHMSHTVDACYTDRAPSIR